MSNRDQGDIYVNGNRIEKTNERVYLGQIGSFMDRMNKELKARRKKE